MLRRYFIPISLIILISVIDLISFRQKPVTDALGFIESYVESQFKAHRDLLFEPDNLALFQNDSLDTEDFNKLKRLERQLDINGISSKLFYRDQLVFWSNEESKDTLCQVFEEAPWRLQLCKVILNKDGALAYDIQHNSFIDRSDKEDAYNGSRLEKWSSLPTLRISRPFRMSIILLLSYSLLILYITLLSLHHRESMGFVLLVLGRLAFLLTGWQGRYDSMLTEPLFTGVSYSSMDLLWDSIIVFGALCLIVIRTTKEKIPDLKNISINLFFFTLLTLSHIRLIQLLVYSDTVLNAFNDLSLLGVNDLLAILSVLIIQAGIFIFGYRSFLAFTKIKTKRRNAYGLLAAFALAGTALAWLVDLHINPFVLLFFLTAYFLLFDLFADVTSKNITWIIWWAIFYSVYLSALFFNFDIRNNLKERLEFLQEIIVDTPYEDIEAIQASGILDSLDEYLDNLLTLPEEATYDKEDFETYATETLGRDDLDIEIFDSTGTYLFDESPYLRTRNQLITLDSMVELDEVRKKIWFSSQLPSGHLVKISFPFAQTQIPEDFEFNYYRNGTAVRRDFEVEPVSFRLIAESDDPFVFHDSKAYVMYRPSQDKLLISRKSYSGLIKPIALFSLLFCFVVVLSIVLGLSHAMYRFLPEEWPFRIVRFDSLNSKIQISLIMVILLSFVIIAAITNSFLSNYLAGEKTRFIKDKISSIANEIHNHTRIALSARQALTIASNYESEIEKIHNVNLDILSLVNNDREIGYFTHAYFTKQENTLPYTEQGRDEYISYLPLFFRNELAGVIRVNHRDLRDEKSYVVDFLGSIFNVYVFLFLIASVIAIFIARSVTRPLDILNQKLQALKLGSRNELIDWETDDEIGNLITNYNNMVYQLEESARILAKTERDSAWREMAKQVAHEIKNPLTPMKLSIQYLEKAIKQNPDKAREISKRISSTLLEQIENLTEIANAFSNFAEMPQSSNVKIELNEAVEIVHNLFRKREDMDINLSEPIDPVYVYADKNQLIRILNNLVKNAVESIPENRRGKIDLKLERRKDKAIIRVSDNGIGIPPEMEGKIFQPKFTTKDSGSGLGLAICANMIESMNGRIYFDSRPGEGTDFYIELDIIRPTHYEDANKRITLE